MTTTISTQDQMNALVRAGGPPADVEANGQTVGPGRVIRVNSGWVIVGAGGLAEASAGGLAVAFGGGLAVASAGGLVIDSTPQPRLSRKE